MIPPPPLLTQQQSSHIKDDDEIMMSLDTQQMQLIESVCRQLSTELVTKHLWLFKNNWYHGKLSRQEATERLLSETESGVFLVRDSTSIAGDYVLCVKEENDKVSHYIVNRVKVKRGNGTNVSEKGNQLCDEYVFKIGDQTFHDLNSMLNFYKINYLDSTPLIRPCLLSQRREQIDHILKNSLDVGSQQCSEQTFEKYQNNMNCEVEQPHVVLETVIGKYNFNGKDSDDLPFRKGEVLSVIRKDEEQWWTATNARGDVGSIPLPYVTRLNKSQQSKLTSNRVKNRLSPPSSTTTTTCESCCSDVSLCESKSNSPSNFCGVSVTDTPTNTSSSANTNNNDDSGLESCSCSTSHCNNQRRTQQNDKNNNCDSISTNVFRRQDEVNSNVEDSSSDVKGGCTTIDVVNENESHHDVTRKTNEITKPPMFGRISNTNPKQLITN